MEVNWIETHAHLPHDFTFEAFERLFETGECKKVWLHSIECFRDPDFFAGNDEVLSVAGHFPGQVVPFAYCRPELGADQVRKFKDAGFSGLKFILPTAPYDAQEFFPVYAEAEKLNMPCFFHVGTILNTTSKHLAYPGQLSTPVRMKPSMLDSIAAEFPSLQVIAGHVGFPWCSEMYESLWYYPNIKCCVCGITDYKWLMDSLDARASDGTPFYQKFMFATDSMYGRDSSFSYAHDSAVFSRIFFRDAGKTRLWGAHWEDYLFNNANEVFKN